MQARESIRVLQEHLLDQWNKVGAGDRQRLVLEWIRLKEAMEGAGGANGARPQEQG